MNTDITNVQELTCSDLFLNKLRQSTADSHKKLESLPVSRSITSPQITKSDYTFYLSLMGDVVNDMETHIFPLLKPLLPDIDERRKTSWIVDDLSVLEYRKNPYSPVFKNPAVSVPFALGMMYVVEGSVLGGRFILQNIQASLGFNEEGARYFTGYGNKTGSYWKKFLKAFADYAIINNAEEEMVAGANFAFEQIYKHLNQAANEN
ncbi:MAG: heme oxygenase [Flavobacterium sp. BFFFF1]|uniref:biliverdin-producing heme oxygenase n=1 Tax=unclassified Flavobacterium TaxID=196869 RepID=UPI000BD60ACE|nr:MULTISPECIES: biliverdin-producing heme oxygenase [unclassified Flavobacterium]OYU80776.1 MAG: heme oxygenase [Flavobacterium sp. BFFFF1]